MSFNVKNSISEDVCFLQDFRRNGKERPWKKYKSDSLELADSFRRNGDLSKYVRVRDCGGFLQFGECPNGHEKKLISARFCQVRLCPMCSARRSVLVFQNLREVIHVAKHRENLQFLFLTLTAKSVTSDFVKDELTKYFEAWKRLAKRRPFKSAIVGWFRVMEITHDWKRDLYHPHFHCILAVRPSYFSHGYIRQEMWVEWWRESMRLDYSPIVDIRKVRPKRGKSDVDGAIMETAKYSVKSKDFLIPENQRAQDRAVAILDEALKNRRLVAYGGILKDIRKELKHQDEEKHDLIKVGDDRGDCKCSICNAVYEEAVYQWHVGYRDYVKIDI